MFHFFSSLKPLFEMCSFIFQLITKLEFNFFIFFIFLTDVSPPSKFLRSILEIKTVLLVRKQIPDQYISNQLQDDENNIYLHETRTNPNATHILRHELYCGYLQEFFNIFAWFYPIRCSHAVQIIVLAERFLTLYPRYYLLVISYCSAVP